MVLNPSLHFIWNLWDQNSYLLYGNNVYKGGWLGIMLLKEAVIFAGVLERFEYRSPCCSCVRLFQVLRCLVSTKLPWYHHRTKCKAICPSQTCVSGSCNGLWNCSRKPDFLQSWLRAQWSKLSELWEVLRFTYHVLQGMQCFFLTYWYEHIYIVLEGVEGLHI